MNWKYGLVNKKILDADNNIVDICALHYMFFDENNTILTSEEAVKVEARSPDELVKFLFNMIRTLQSPDLEIMNEDELDM